MEYLTKEQAIALCNQTNHSDLFEQDDFWWGFPPNGVMPVQIARVRSSTESIPLTSMTDRLTRSELSRMSELIPGYVNNLARSLQMTVQQLIEAINRGDIHRSQLREMPEFYPHYLSDVARSLGAVPGEILSAIDEGIVVPRIPPNAVSDRALANAIQYFNGHDERFNSEIVNALRINSELMSDGSQSNHNCRNLYESRIIKHQSFDEATSQVIDLTDNPEVLVFRDVLGLRIQTENIHPDLVRLLSSAFYFNTHESNLPYIKISEALTPTQKRVMICEVLNCSRHSAGLRVKFYFTLSMIDGVMIINQRDC